MIKNAILAWLIPALLAVGLAGASYALTNTSRISKVEQKQSDDSDRLERVEKKVDEILRRLPQ